MSLGAHEVEDVAVLVEHIRKEYPSSIIGLWGRSMGAVTVLLYSKCDPSIAGVVRHPKGTIVRLSQNQHFLIDVQDLDDWHAECSASQQLKMKIK